MNWSKIAASLRNPESIRRKIRINLVRPFTKQSYNPIDYINQDWDVLVILDACRYDLLANNNPFDVPVKKVHSNASHTREFLRKNFGDETHPDIVYVTASPQLTSSKASFAHVEHVWQNHWDDEYRTVLPEDVTDAALDIDKRFPNKRLIIHYMQPHYPFIGPTGEKIGDHATFTGGLQERQYASVWEMLADGEVNEDIVKKAYTENLELLLPEVKKLVTGVTGKTVITSDHGNLFGKRVSPLPIKLYGHPHGITDPELTAVPWVVLPDEQRRQVSEAALDNSTSGDFENVEERLRDLGYK